jgi:hypothetical protein
MAHGHGPGPVDPGFDPADPEYGVTPPGSTYEHTDAHVWLITKFLFWLLVTAVITHFGLGFMYQMMIEQGQRLEEGEIRFPLAAGEEQRLPPVPRLQQSPANEIFDYRRNEFQVLNNYGWLNREMGTVHIPISEAMRLVVERGLPSRPPDSAQPGETLGLMPADSSSGRTMQQRRQ